ncbi:hypothetical protein GJ496_011789 [Pomphorhynchus laevis]|nr:hypothetical protein GJ496_011789 [Pomphorhynchus laevis]
MDNVVIRKADKSNSAVVWEKEEYISERLRQLNTTNYEAADAHTLSSLNERLSNLISRHTGTGFLQVTDRDKLVPTSWNIEANATNAHSDTELNNKDITGASTSVNAEPSHVLESTQADPDPSTTVNTEPSHVLEPTQADPDQANATTAHPDTELNNKDITGGIANYALSLLSPTESSSSNHSQANATNAHSDTELNNKDITGASTSVNTEPSHVLEPTQADPDRVSGSVIAVIVTIIAILAIMVSTMLAQYMMTRRAGKKLAVDEEKGKGTDSTSDSENILNNANSHKENADYTDGIKSDNLPKLGHEVNKVNNSETSNEDNSDGHINGSLDNVKNDALDSNDQKLTDL